MNIRTHFLSRNLNARIGLSICATVCTFGGLILGACSSGEKAGSQANAGISGGNTANDSKSQQSSGTSSPQWSTKMQELSRALNQLLPLVSDGKAFGDPRNESALKEATSRLKSLSHQVKSMTATPAKPSADPAIDSIAKMLDEDLARAVAALETGNRDYARLTLRESIGYCIQCHTQTSNGPSFPKLELGFDPSKLSPLGQGDYYAATRQFDSALAAYRKGVNDSSYAERDIFGWERAVRSGLAIAVRFKESAGDAEAFVKAISHNKQAPQSLKDSAQDWLSSIQEWAKEKPSKKPNRLAHAEKLIRDAEAKLKDNPRRSEDIAYLRASSDLHQWLAQNPKADASNHAKALLYAGLAAEATRELNFWTLHERYYELCIQTLPKSTTAKECFNHLNESVTLGYTGSSGLNLPEDEKLRLAKLKELAFGQ